MASKIIPVRISKESKGPLLSGSLMVLEMLRIFLRTLKKCSQNTPSFTWYIDICHVVSADSQFTSGFLGDVDYVEMVLCGA